MVNYAASLASGGFHRRLNIIGERKSSLHHFPCNRLQGQFVKVPRRHLGRFHQHVLDMLVPLLGNRHAHHLVGRTLLGAAQTLCEVPLTGGSQNPDPLLTGVAATIQGTR